MQTSCCAAASSACARCHAARTSASLAAILDGVLVPAAASRQASKHNVLVHHRACAASHCMVRCRCVVQSAAVPERNTEAVRGTTCRNGCNHSSRRWQCAVAAGG